jgi:putative transposase
MGGSTLGRDPHRAPGPVQVRQAYKFRAYPTRPQEGRTARLLADHCDLYNAALEERRDDVNGARNVYTRAGLGSGQAVQAA